MCIHQNARAAGVFIIYSQNIGFLEILFLIGIEANIPYNDQG
jgi:hypothetical protein